jgi:hypothetical protein
MVSIGAHHNLYCGLSVVPTETVCGGQKILPACCGRKTVVSIVTPRFIAKSECRVSHDLGERRQSDWFARPRELNVWTRNSFTLSLRHGSPRMALEALVVLGGEPRIETSLAMHRDRQETLKPPRPPSYGIWSQPAVPARADLAPLCYRESGLVTFAHIKFRRFPAGLQAMTQGC